MRNLRIFIAGLVAAGVTFGLFLFMFKLVSMGSDQRTELDAIAGIHFGPVEIPDEIVEKTRRKPPKPPPPKEPPPPPRMGTSIFQHSGWPNPPVNVRLNSSAATRLRAAGKGSTTATRSISASAAAF